MMDGAVCAGCGALRRRGARPFCLAGVWLLGGSQGVLGPVLELVRNS